ncbi:MAG: hypothetical protein ACQESP_07660, partial [Candidatus Muiribacteriota bacterium]
MKNIKRDLLILAIALFSLLHGCLSSDINQYSNSNKTQFDVFESTSIKNSLNQIFSLINRGKYSQAVRHLEIFSPDKLSPEELKLYNLATGIVHLNNKLYEKALDYFSKATPLPDAYIGKITCRLKL